MEEQLEELTESYAGYDFKPQKIEIVCGAALRAEEQGRKDYAIELYAEALEEVRSYNEELDIEDGTGSIKDMLSEIGDHLKARKDSLED